VRVGLAGCAFVFACQPHWVAMYIAGCSTCVSNIYKYLDIRNLLIYTHVRGVRVIVSHGDAQKTEWGPNPLLCLLPSMDRAILQRLSSSPRGQCVHPGGQSRHHNQIQYPKARAPDYGDKKKLEREQQVNLTASLVLHWHLFSACH
jgi:hypothetical protein